jgi:hypothetical protein
MAVAYLSRTLNRQDGVPPAKRQTTDDSVLVFPGYTRPMRVDDLPAYVREHFKPTVERLRRTDKPDLFRHVTRHPGRPPRDGVTRWYVQLPRGGRFVLLALVAEAELGAILAAAALEDATIKTRRQMEEWISGMCISRAAFTTWTANRMRTFTQRVEELD